MRVLKYYVPCKELSGPRRKKRNILAAERNQKHHQKIKQIREEQQLETHAVESTSGQKLESLVLRLPFNQQKIMQKKRRKLRIERKRREEIRKVQDNVKRLTMKCRTKQK